MPTFDEIMDKAAKADAAATSAKASGDTTRAAEAENDARQLVQAAKAMKAQEVQQPSQPEPQGQPHSPGTAIATSAAVGTAIGAASPELLIKGGQQVQRIPAATPYLGKVAKPVGAAMVATGEAIKGAKYGRVLASLDGAINGAVAESAGQLADSMGAGNMSGMAVRFGVGMITPGAATIGMFLGGKLKTGVTAIQKMTSGAAESVPKAVATARELLSSSAFHNIPELHVYGFLNEAAEANRAAAEKAAGHVLSEAHQRAASMARTDGEGARRVVEAATIHGDALKNEAAKTARVLDVAANGKLKTAARVLALSEKDLAATVGQPALPSDVGNALRQRVTAEQGKMIEERAAQYKVLEGQRDAAVAAKEGQGLFIDSVPEVKALKEEIAQKLLLTKKGRDASTVATADGKSVGKADVTDPGLRTAYGKMYEAISNRRVQTGVSEDGTPTYATFKTTFEALDAVRRKLGDVAYGKEAEGYSALGQGLAKQWYQRLAKIQEDYAGPAQAELQKGYASATTALGKYKTAGGKRVVEMEPHVADAFAKDPASIPGAFFKSQQGVKDLVALTGGDTEGVAAAARSHVAHELHGMSQAQVQKWAKGNSDWVREVPGLAKDVQTFAGRVGQIERVAGKAPVEGKEGGKLGEKAAWLRGKAGEVVKEATGKAATVEGEAQKVGAEALKQSKAKQAGVVEGAESQAKALREAALKQVEKAKGDGYPTPTVKQFLLGGAREEHVALMRSMAGVPGGKTAVEGAVRNAMRDLGPTELPLKWGRLQTAMKEAQVLDPIKLAKLDKDVQGVLKAYSPAEAKKRVNSLVVMALGGAAALAGGAAGRVTGGRAEE